MSGWRPFILWSTLIDPWFPKWLLNCEGLIFWHDWYVSQIFQPWLYTDFWLVSALQRQINEIRWNLPSRCSKGTKRIVSPWVKAIKRWPWLMRRFESLMKSSIEPNTPTRRDPLPFLLISYQLLHQHNITVNLLTLCPFPEPNSRVLELDAHSFFPPHLSQNGGEQPGQDSYAAIQWGSSPWPRRGES